MPIPQAQIPNYQIQQPDLMANYARMVSLKNMLAQQQELPLDLQIKQQQVQQAQSQTQLAATEARNAQLDLQQRQNFVNALSDPDLSLFGESATPSRSATTPTKAPDASGASPPPAAGGTGAPVAASASPQGNDIGFDPNVMTQKLLKAGAGTYGINFVGQLVKRASDFSEAIKNDAEAASARADAYQKGVSTLTDKMADIRSMPLDKAIQAFNELKQYVAAGNVPGLPQTEITAFSNSTLDHLPAFISIGKIESRMAATLKDKADAALAEQNADPVYQLSKPQSLADPGAQAAINAKIADPKTDPADIPRLQALLPKAAVAQQNASVIKARDEQAQQAISQGDPNAAGQLLASRALTIDELKLRNATPQFMEKAVMAAQKIDPNFKAAEASAQGKIAASPANQQFFGNTDSLLIKGGTLDQLQSAADALGNSKFPALNSLDNWRKAALGQGPQAQFAAAALGVADDYSKVMTGGQGSDTSRLQALNIIAKNQSPQQLQAAIGQIRQQVESQREGRLGTNPYLRDMYPNPTKAPGGDAGAAATVTMKAPNGQTKSVPADQVDHYKSLGAMVVSR